MRIKLNPVGDSASVLLSKDMLARLGVDKDGALHAIDTPGGLILSAHDPQFLHRLEIVERLMREDRDVLQRLARSA